ncbi:hypothetical protein [Tardiphaga robiniae]|uniref:Uncharacterized protein n=1 Tax=Tardiphaga robiniae TaxID=943830 RepID=A0A7G6TYZ3_9BRAD|nr:hypothetical protein [Tardiphaga robiniae]QND71975.1 hypothetical protein HB776_12610 [Tardiphaga robiniae]
MNAAEAIWYLQDNRAAIVEAAHLPATGLVQEAYAALLQPGRVHVQSLAGLGAQLPLMGDETTEHYLWRLHEAPFLDRYAIVRRALLSNVWLELPDKLAAVLIQEASEALESAPARLVSVKQVTAARRVNIVTDDEKAERVFLRAIEYGGGGILEIQSNATGPLIEPDPIGTLSRAMLSQCRWRLSPGWWCVQPGGQRTGNRNTVTAPPRPLAPNPGDETPQPSGEAPQP